MKSKTYKVKLTTDQIFFLFTLLDKSEHKDFKDLRKIYLKIIKKKVKVFQSWKIKACKGWKKS